MSRSDARREDGGQTLIIVALMLSLLLGFAGLVADIGWYGLSLLRVQRAADAGVLTRGGQHSNGDAYSPQYDGGTNPNAQYDPNGYSYTIEIPSGSSMGEVWLFDATFCAVGHGPSGSYLGTGDHWIGPGGAPVTTTYRLWDTQGTPYTTDDDVLVTDSGSRFSNEDQIDRSSE